MSGPFLTIGHSNRAITEFVELLRDSGVGLVVDVRKLPGSARYPQFNEDALSEVLAAHDIRFRRAEGLTGRRPVSKDVPFGTNAWWKNRSFHNYADYAMSAQFHLALADLRERGGPQRTAVMCSEAVWWRCHRRIIADYLLVNGEEALHILGKGHTVAAELSLGAVVGDDLRVTYPLA